MTPQAAGPAIRATLTASGLWPLPERLPRKLSQEIRRGLGLTPAQWRRALSLLRLQAAREAAPARRVEGWKRLAARYGWGPREEVRKWR
jgi:hypothetical protein